MLKNSYQFLNVTKTGPNLLQNMSKHTLKCPNNRPTKRSHKNPKKDPQINPQKYQQQKANGHPRIGTQILHQKSSKDPEKLF